MVEYKQIEISLLNDIALLAAYNQKPKFELYVNNNYKTFDANTFTFLLNPESKGYAKNAKEFLKSAFKYQATYVAKYLERFMDENFYENSYGSREDLHSFSLHRGKRGCEEFYNCKLFTVFNSQEKDRVEIGIDFSFSIENNEVKNFVHSIETLRVYVLQDMENEFPVAF